MVLPIESSICPFLPASLKEKVQKTNPASIHKTLAQDRKLPQNPKEIYEPISRQYRQRHRRKTSLETSVLPRVDARRIKHGGAYRLFAAVLSSCRSVSDVSIGSACKLR